MAIDRREFVRRTAFMAGVTSLPEWVSRAFSQDPEDEKNAEKSRAQQLKAAHRRAEAWGKPLLVFVVPAANDKRWARGLRLGALLNHGGDRFLLDLALCEPACATVGELEKQLGVLKVAGEPLMLLVEPARGEGGGSAQVTAIEVEFDAEPALDGAAYQEDRASLEEYHVECSEKIAAAVREAVVRDRGVLSDRADRVRGTLAEDEHGALHRYLAQAGPAPSEEALVRAAAVVRMGAEAPRFEGDRERLQGALAAAVKKTFIEQRIPGSKWAKSQGCGTEIEGEKAQGMIACGMGHTPVVCQRFLYLFTE